MTVMIKLVDAFIHDVFDEQKRNAILGEFRSNAISTMNNHVSIIISIDHMQYSLNERLFVRIQFYEFAYELITSC